MTKRETGYLTMTMQTDCLMTKIVMPNLTMRMKIPMVNLNLTTKTPNQMTMMETDCSMKKKTIPLKSPKTEILNHLKDLTCPMAKTTRKIMTLNLTS